MAMTPEEVQSAIRSLDFNIDSLRSNVTLTKLQKETSALEHDLDNFAVRLKEIREHGYVFESELEGQIEGFSQSWKDMEHTISADLRRRARPLEEDFATIDSSLRRIKAMASRPNAVTSQLTRIKTQIDDLEDMVETAEEAIRSRYQPLKNDISAFDNHLRKLEWMYEELLQASFELLETEALVMAAEVRWYHDGKADKRDPKGILFLTGQRLILEIHETEVKKKVLFIKTETETTRSLAFECPVAYIERTESFQEGMLKGQDHLRLYFTSQGPYDQTQFQLLNGDNDEFCQTIRRIQAGDFLKNRTEEIQEEVLERVKNAPSECPSCGGNISQKIMRGQDSITCEYCGYVIRL